MIVATPETIPGEHGRESHGGKGEYFVRTLLDGLTGGPFKYVRDLILYPGSTIGEHLHSGDEEIYMVISGGGTMVVDGQERFIGSGSVVLTHSGSCHALRNESTEDLHILVVCARALDSLRD